MPDDDFINTKIGSYRIRFNPARPSKVGVAWALLGGVGWTVLTYAGYGTIRHWIAYMVCMMVLIHAHRTWYDYRDARRERHAVEAGVDDDE